MPKEVFEYKNFRGGIRQDIQNLDIPIEDGYLLQAVNFHYGGSSDGSYSPLGDNYSLKSVYTSDIAHQSDATVEGATGYIDTPTTHGGTGSDGSTNYTMHGVNPGNGLFFFSSDWDTNSGTFANCSDTGAGDNFLVARTDNDAILIYSYAVDKWFAKFEYAFNSGHSLPLNVDSAGNFTCWVPDGALRVCGSNTNGSTDDGSVHWFGYIKRDCFGITDFRDDWYGTLNYISYPLGTCKAVASGTFDAYASGDYPTNGAGINVEIAEISAQAGEGGWMAGTYDLAFSHLYDNVGFLGQESALSIPTSNNTFTIADDNAVIVVKVGLKAQKDTGGGSATPSDTPARMAGLRIYYRLNTGDEWNLLVDGDIVNGIRGDMFSDYSIENGKGWRDQDPTNVTYYMSEVNITNPSPDTFATINGFSSSETNYHLQQMTPQGGAMANPVQDSTVLNGRVFVGAYLRKIAGQYHVWGDRVMYSEVGRPDMAPDSNVLDILPSDGDVITGLTSYDDNLLVFKKKLMIVVNIADVEPSGWYIVSKNVGMGIQQKYSYYETDKGIIWASDKGVYLFDGELQHLSENITPLWNNFNNGTTNIMWVPSDEEVFFFKNPTATGADTYPVATANGQSLIYNFKNNSWTGLHTADVCAIRHYNCSNFVLDHNQDVVYLIALDATHAYTKIITKGKMSSNATTGKLVFPETDFGNRFSLKKIYHIAITHSSEGLADEDVLYYTIDGQYDTAPVKFGDNHDFPNNSTSTGYGMDYTKTIITPAIPLVCYTFQPIISITTGATIIKDISISYRTLHKVHKNKVWTSGDQTIHAT